MGKLRFISPCKSWVPLKFWIFSVWSDKLSKWSINMCTCSDSGAFAGAGAVRNVHCAVCRVQCAACQRWKFSSWKKMSQSKILSFKITSQKPIALMYFFRTGWDYWFLKAWNEKQNFYSKYPKSIFQVILRNTFFRVQDVCQINIPGDCYQFYV